MGDRKIANFRPTRDIGPASKAKRPFTSSDNIFTFYFAKSRLWKRTGLVEYGPRKPRQRMQQSIRAIRSPESRVLRAERNSFLGHITFKS